MIGKLNKAQINELLTSRSSDALPATTTAFSTWCRSATPRCIYARFFEGTKMVVMRSNPQVCFEVDDARDMTNWQSVIAWGTFEELTEAADRKHALQMLLQRHLPLSSSVTTHLGKTWPFSKDDLEDITDIVYRIELTKKTGMFEQTSYEAPSNID